MGQRLAHVSFTNLPIFITVVVHRSFGYRFSFDANVLVQFSFESILVLCSFKLNRKPWQNIENVYIVFNLNVPSPRSEVSSTGLYHAAKSSWAKIIKLKLAKRIVILSALFYRFEIVVILVLVNKNIH